MERLYRVLRAEQVCPSRTARTTPRPTTMASKTPATTSAAWSSRTASRTKRDRGLARTREPAHIRASTEPLEKSNTMSRSPRAFRGVPPIGAFIGALGMAAVVVSGVAMRSIWQGRPTPPDMWWHDLVAGHRIAPAEAAAQFLNTFGGTLSMTAVTTTIVVALLITRRWRESLTIGLTVALASGLSTVLKIVIARPRPPDGVVDVGSNSFPSGHTTTAAAYYRRHCYCIPASVDVGPCRGLGSHHGVKQDLLAGALAHGRARRCDSWRRDGTACLRHGHRSCTRTPTITPSTTALKIKGPSQNGNPNLVTKHP